MKEISPPDNGLNLSNDAPELTYCVSFPDDGLDFLHSLAAWRFDHIYSVVVRLWTYNPPPVPDLFSSTVKTPQPSPRSTHQPLE